MLVTVNRLSELTALDRRRIGRRLAALPVAKMEGKARLFESSAALRLLYGTGDADKLDPQEQRARLDKARADMAEMDLAERRGQVLQADTVATLWSEQISIAKGRLLAIPARVAPELVGREMHEMEQAVRDHIHEALLELSRGDDGGPTAVAKVD